MILSDLLGSRVVDHSDAPVGHVIDVRFQLEGGGTPSQARVVGIIISPRRAGSFLGYERTGLDRPAILARVLRWMHRGSFMVPWSDIRRIDEGRVTLRDRYERQPSSLAD